MRTRRNVCPWRHSAGTSVSCASRNSPVVFSATANKNMPAIVLRSSVTRLSSILNDLFCCPVCSSSRKRATTSKLPRRAFKNRHASTLTSSTAVNATKAIPTRNKALYESLQDLKKKAYVYVNLSRLQLAIQSLETDTPTTRVAVLGLNVSNTARRLVRLMLADALTPEEPWEKQLLSNSENFARGLLIRYGEPPNPSLQQICQEPPIISIPALVLQRNNLEILVSSVNAPSARAGLSDGNTTSDALLSPTVGMPSDASGRQIMINQPVHKSLLVAENLHELIGVAELLASTRFS